MNTPNFVAFALALAFIPFLVDYAVSAHVDVVLIFIFSLAHNVISNYNHRVFEIYTQISASNRPAQVDNNDDGLESRENETKLTWIAEKIVLECAYGYASTEIFFSSLNILIFDTHGIRVELMISGSTTETDTNFKQNGSNT